MRPAFWAKCGSLGKIQLRWYQGRMASWESQRHSVVSPIVATNPRFKTSRLISAMLKRDSGTPSVQGNSQARAFTSTTVSGGKERGPSAAREFLEAGEALLKEALPPFADDLSRCIESLGDLIVGEAGSGIEDDLGPDNVSIRRRISSGLGFQPHFVFGGEGDGEWACSWHRPWAPSLPQG